MRITPIMLLSEQNYQKKQQPLNKQYLSRENNYTSIVPIYNDYLLSFGARVDKGLERFYDVNKDIMPQRVREYIEGLEDKSTKTPMEAQREAYAFLNMPEITVEEIKDIYPELSTLKNPEESKAPTGILHDINGFSDMLEADGKGALKNKENLTVYIVKKIFLENKTLQEINQDLENDLDPDLKAAYRYKDKEAQFLHHSTLSALGITAPNRDYRQSLRYTRDGYSDIMGEKISNFWNSLSETERTARAKKSVANFENWWTSIPMDKKLDLLTQQDATLTMLEQYKQAQAASPNDTTKTRKVTPTEAKSSTPKPKSHTHVGSSKLSEDELFIKWATNNLKIFNENLTDNEKNALNIKRIQALSDNWNKMSPAERTEYIAKLKTGQEPLRFTMIDAWNNSFDVITDLSKHLREKHIERASDIIYSSEPFSEFQSRVMTEFWAEYPEHAEKLGEAIKNSNIKVKEAISNGTFEHLKQEILKVRSQRIQMLKAIKPKPIAAEPIPETYMDEFKRAYCNAPETSTFSKILPKSYMKDYFRIVEETCDEPTVRAWTKNLLNKEPLTDEEYELLKPLMQTEPEEIKKINRALEATIAHVLYENTGNPEVFMLTYTDLKVALAQVARKEPEINIISHNLNQQFVIPVKKHKINNGKIESIYNSFLKPLSKEDMKKIIHGFFKFENEEIITIIPQKGITIELDPETKALEKYLETYGQSANIIFSPKSTYPESAKRMMLFKFLRDIPDSGECLVADSSAHLRENGIKDLTSALNNRFSFIPKQIMNFYTEEVSRNMRLRQANFFEIEEMISKIGKKRKNASESSSIAILPKESLSLTSKLKMLSAEQILAERLYDSTKNPGVFALHFEELCDKLEIFNLLKKFPNEESLNFTSSDKEPISLKPLKKPDLKDIASEFEACFDGLFGDWLGKDFAIEKIGKLKTLVDNLANGEVNPEILKNIEKRIGHYRFPLI